ncbi:cell envelope biogenesis protein OmpA [Flavobacterium album]|uniref:Cell envelope biogenesis protein OmpA n=1 Tax=Flavobacterium album TaxID=2175091 RepID=A0A2S1QYU6_9FLAO|nr:OmpA family protein [Flavobacterium album]AWH85568.1 cell envelope biogenesis protein OmpA [Flavobacterium album]
MKKLFSFALLFLLPLTLAAQEQFSVYFDTNKDDLTKAQQQRLTEWIAANKGSKILAINGYTDEDGSIGLNDSLAQRRVLTVFAQTKGKVNTREDFRTRSFGKLHKMSPVKAENRKVTLYYLQEKDLAKENEILGITEAPKEPVKPKVKEVVEYPSEITVHNPDGKEETLKLDVAFMKKVGDGKPGDVIVINNLNFYENTFAVVRESRYRMFELLETMRANPYLKIKLQGHVCCMKADRQDLSNKRAKAIMQFLNTNGIEKNRLTFEGFGVSKPLFPIPEKSAEEAAANRRVEILIVENP